MSKLATKRCTVAVYVTPARRNETNWSEKSLENSLEEPLISFIHSSASSPRSGVVVR
jgi:hypothetical protein